MTPPSQVPVFTAPMGGRKLSPAQWRKIESFLDQWKLDVLAAARAHPARSYKLGVRQIEAFADLLGGLKTAVPIESAFGGVGPSMQASAKWAQTYTLHELDDALNKYIGRIKDALLYGIRGALNPTAIASLMYRATNDATINWRMIARTEMARANAMGRLHAIAAMGYERVWCPPHVGSCASCKRLIENKDFRLADVVNATNYGRPQGEWVACIPLHPHCRHSWLPYDEEIVGDARRHYAKLEAAGLTDEARLAELFDESGQLRPEHADVDLSAAVWDDTGKSRTTLMDVYAEGLAAVIVAKRDYGIHKTTSVRWVPADEIRGDIYQRELDPDKVLSMHRELRNGGELPRPRVSAREDGTHYVYDGQHRVEARKLNGEDMIECDVAHGMGPLEEAAACREAIAKCWAPAYSWNTASILDDDVAKSMSAMPSTLAQALAPDVAESSEPEDLAHDPLLWDGARLRDDIALALETWWARVAGDDWPTFSHLYVPLHPGAPVRALVDYDQLRAHVHEWRELSDADLHLALVAASRGAGAEIHELAPGLPMDVRVIPANPASHPADDDTGPLWGLGEQTWLDRLRDGTAPEPLTEKSAAERWPAYAWSLDEDLTFNHQLRGSGEASPLMHRLVDGELVAKSPQAAANVGVEHWITIHPHGDEEKGQPVLVRNGADGTMTVIGGAGGNLNHLRLDPSRRVDRDASGKPRGAKGGGKVEQAVSEEEAQRKQAEREQEIAGAREQLAAATAKRQELQQQLHGFIHDELGIDLNDPEIDSARRRKLLSKIRTSALRTLAYGAVTQRDTGDSASRDDLGLDKPDAPKGLEPDEKVAQEDGNDVARNPRPQVAQTPEQARAILDQLLDLARVGKAAGAQRRVINGEARGADANQIDWSLGGEEGRDERRAKAVQAVIRTDLARDLQELGDRQFTKSGGKDQRYRAAFSQGGYDTVDAFANSILGHGIMRRATSDLLGVAGAAQLVAYRIQQEAIEKGKKGLDLDKIQGALKDLTDNQEKAVTERGIDRINTSAERATAAMAELTKSERGESLFTTTMARSIASEKVQEAKRGLGMMIGGLEACSALKVALDRKAGEKIKVGGFSSPAQIRELAAKANVKLRDGDVVRVGAGNYTLSIDPERLANLVKPTEDPQAELKARLQKIRTGEGLDEEITKAQNGPGMSDELDRNQAKGKLALLEAGSHLLGFDPGVGKTHTAIAAAMQLMADKPGKHRALIVCPTNMLRSWADTITAQGPGHTVQVVGQSETDPSKDTGSTAVKKRQLMGDHDFTVIGYESLASYRDELKRERGEGEGQPHSIVIADELQKAKNEATANFDGVRAAVDAAREHHGDATHFFGLTGTPVEKDVSDVRSMRELVARAKGKEIEDRASYRRKYGKLGQDEHIARGDKVAQFRESLDADLFRLSAQDAGNDLGEPKRAAHKVKLDPAHTAEIQQRVNAINTRIADYHERKKNGELRIGKDGKLEKPIPFGGRDALMDALYGREDSAINRSVADEIEKTATFKHKGGKYHLADGSIDPSNHAGEYEHKHVVFGANETSRALFGTKEGGGGFDPEGKGGLAGELRKRGVKVFIGHGSMKGGSAGNEASYKAFLAHKGKAVFVTNDKNNAGISLQFGDNKGVFQHGATHMHHLTRPVNNATIQQREARILRKGAEAGAQYHTYDAGTPIEQRLQETLDRELRTQDLAANSEQRVAGAETLRHHLRERGVKPQHD